MQEKIVQMLEQVLKTQQEHGQLLQEQGRTLKEHGQLLQEQGRTLKEHGQLLQEQGRTLKEHGQLLQEQDRLLKEHGETLKEHSHVLSALRTGQEATNAKLDGMELRNAKDLGEMKEKFDTVEAGIAVLKDDTWSNKKDIYRIKNVMGMN
ncbi:hypothetical protein [Bacillus fonticola]|uniref:hypothetical protein n=1 Tax=Bacillus fonticola TaxID=2728853 RepID=UPI0014739341|nr:hypothetical protein [Bacillus fonticola]